MSDFAKKITQIAQSRMSREALSHWEKFKLPERNEQIEDLLKKLGETPPDARSKRRIGGGETNNSGGN